MKMRHTLASMLQAVILMSLSSLISSVPSSSSNQSGNHNTMLLNDIIRPSATMPYTESPTYENIQRHPLPGKHESIHNENIPGMDTSDSIMSSSTSTPSLSEFNKEEHSNPPSSQINENHFLRGSPIMFNIASSNSYQASITPSNTDFNPSTSQPTPSYFVPSSRHPHASMLNSLQPNIPSNSSSHQDSDLIASVFTPPADSDILRSSIDASQVIPEASVPFKDLVYVPLFSKETPYLIESSSTITRDENTFTSTPRLKVTRNALFDRVLSTMMFQDMGNSVSSSTVFSETTIPVTNSHSMKSTTSITTETGTWKLPRDSHVLAYKPEETTFTSTISPTQSFSTSLPSVTTSLPTLKTLQSYITKTTASSIMRSSSPQVKSPSRSVTAPSSSKTVKAVPITAPSNSTTATPSFSSTELSPLTSNVTTITPTPQDEPTARKMLFHTLPNYIKQNPSPTPPNQISVTDNPVAYVNTSSEMNNSTKLLREFESSTISTPTQNESQSHDFNVAATSTEPNTEKRTHNSTSEILNNSDRVSNGCNCSSSITESLKLELYLLRKFIPRLKTVKSSANEFKFSDNEYSSRKSDNPSTTEASQQPMDHHDSGIVCYDDRMSISSQEVECPKPSTRKMTLANHHLQQILKNEGGGNSAFSYVSPDDFQEVDIDVADDKVAPRAELVNSLQSLLKDQGLFHQNLRQDITETFISSIVRDILSLTSFLKAYIDKTVQENASDEWEKSDFYFYCKMKKIDVEIIKKSYTLLENEMLEPESHPHGMTNLDYDLKKLYYYNYRSSKLIHLKEELKSHLIHLNSTFEDVSHVFSRTSFNHSISKQNTNNTHNKVESHSTVSREDAVQPQHTDDSHKYDQQPLPKQTLDCPPLMADFETKSKQEKSSTQQKNDFEEVSEPDVTQKTRKIFGCFGSIVTELFDSISSTLKLLAIPGDSSATMDALRNLENRSASINEKFTELEHRRLEHGRAKRSVVGSSSDACHDQGSLVPNTDFRLMCSTCVKTTTLSADYFPRHITEKTCKNNSPANVQSGSVPLQNGCLSEGGRPGGWCQQQTMTILLLHRNPGNCMKISSRGREFITDQWKLVTYKLRTGCECMVDKNSQFAQYLTF